jgi:glycosyltransferase involved in cell wall biosynthesis
MRDLDWSCSEAIGNQTPTLAANNSAIPEVLGHDFPGLFETSDWESLFAKTQQTERAKFRQTLLDAQELKERNTSEPEVMAKKIQDVYEGVLK